MRNKVKRALMLLCSLTVMLSLTLSSAAPALEVHRFDVVEPQAGGALFVLRSLYESLMLAFGIDVAEQAYEEYTEDPLESGPITSPAGFGAGGNYRPKGFATAMEDMLDTLKRANYDLGGFLAFTGMHAGKTIAEVWKGKGFDVASNPEIDAENIPYLAIPEADFDAMKQIVYDKLKITGYGPKELKVRNVVYHRLDWLMSGEIEQNKDTTRAVTTALNISNYPLGYYYYFYSGNPDVAGANHYLYMRDTGNRLAYLATGYWGRLTPSDSRLVMYATSGGFSGSDISLFDRDVTVSDLSPVLLYLAKGNRIAMQYTASDGTKRYLNATGNYGGSFSDVLGTDVQERPIGVVISPKAINDPLADTTTSVSAKVTDMTAVKEQAVTDSGHVVVLPAPAEVVVDTAAGTATVVRAPDTTIVYDTTNIIANPAIPDVPDIELPNVPDLLLPSSLADKFPFCLPFDFYRLVSIFAADPVAPYWDIPFSIPQIGLDERIVIDLSQFDWIAEIVRGIELIVFAAVLLFATNYLIGRS